jgi:hypothetical protein
VKQSLQQPSLPRPLLSGKHPPPPPLSWWLLSLVSKDLSLRGPPLCDHSCQCRCHPNAALPPHLLPPHPMCPPLLHRGEGERTDRRSSEPLRQRTASSSALTRRTHDEPLRRVHGVGLWRWRWRWRRNAPLPCRNGSAPSHLPCRNGSCRVDCHHRRHHYRIAVAPLPPDCRHPPWRRLPLRPPGDGGVVRVWLVILCDPPTGVVETVLWSLSKACTGNVECHSLFLQVVFVHTELPS